MCLTKQKQNKKKSSKPGTNSLYPSPKAINSEMELAYRVYQDKSSVA